MSPETRNAVDLEYAVSTAILEWNRDDLLSGDLATEAHTTLGIVEEDTVMVYVMALHMIFGYSGGGLSEMGGSHMPVASSFDKETDGEYVMT